MLNKLKSQGEHPHPGHKNICDITAIWEITKQFIQKIGHAECCIVSIKVNSETILAVSLTVYFLALCKIKVRTFNVESYVVYLQLFSERT